MNKTQKGQQMKMGFFQFLQAMFIVLKVAGQTQMSWIQVFIPTYIGFILYLLVGLGKED